MSSWKTISIDDIELDRDEINVLVSTDDYGNNYIVLKVKDVKKALKEYEDS